MENIEVYKFSNRVYFVDNDTKVEGTIVLGYGNHGGETYPYISHIEIEDYKGMDETECEEMYEAYLDNNLDKVLNAKKL
jgi:hypothetical protein